MSCASCNGCQRVCSLIACPSVIQIGAIEDLDIDVDVYIERVNANKVWKFTATSSADYGIVSVDVSDISEALSGNSSFNIWVVPSGGDMSGQLPITLESGETVDCAIVSFNRVVNSDDDSLSLSPQTLQT